MRKRFYRLMMKFTYRKALKLDKKYDYWCREYAKWAKKYRDVGGIA